MSPPDPLGYVDRPSMEIADVPPHLARLIRDPAAAPAPSPFDHAHALLRAHLIRRISRALEAADLSAILVKGAALALTVYPDAASRPMGDIDLLARRADRDRIVAALIGAGSELRAPPGRPWSADLLGEAVVAMQAGATALLVEVHTTLDKIVARPVDMRALFARATPAPDLPGLRIPSPEDHAILIAIHAAGHDFHHAAALLDLALLLRKGLDLPALAARARGWRAQTALFVLFSMLRDLGAPEVSDADVAMFDPGPLRRAALRRRAAHVGSSEDLGLPWMIRQTPLRDDLGGWALGVCRYAAVRGVERIFFAKR